GLLHRHRWRKLTPRPHHAEQTPVLAEAFKKTPEILETIAQSLPAGIRMCVLFKTRDVSDASATREAVGRRCPCGPPLAVNWSANMSTHTWPSALPTGKCLRFAGPLRIPYA